MALGRHSLRGRKICRQKIFCKTFLITDDVDVDNNQKKKIVHVLIEKFRGHNLALGALEHKNGPGYNLQNCR